MQIYLEKLLNHKDLSLEEMMQAIELCINGQATTSEIAAFLTALRSKGETATEFTGVVNVIRQHAELSNLNIKNVMDNCGTGGDSSNSFNISTTASFIIAGVGVKLAKHGNRSISSKTGSADVLERLGVSLSLTKTQIEYILQHNNIVFLFAPHIHHSLKKLMTIRRDLKIPTIFNMIGPLTNPIDLDSQLIGVYDQKLIPTFIHALKLLNRRRAIVVHGANGLDEISLSGTNHLALLNDGDIKYFTLHPDDINYPTYSPTDIQGGTADENAKILLDVLKGYPSAYLDTAIVNAAVGLFANGICPTIHDGITFAKHSIHSGAALQQLERLITLSQSNITEVN